jgi:cell division protein FtsB
VNAVDAGALRARRPRPAARRRTSRPSTRRIAPTAAALLALCAILLVGVVFVQIAVIRQNMERSDLETRAGVVSAQNRDLETQIQQAQSSPEVQTEAQRLGMVAAPPALAHPLTGRPFAHG